jgi:eukaryotic-like serine/threonine-protein kinase
MKRTVCLLFVLAVAAPLAAQSVEEHHLPTWSFATEGPIYGSPTLHDDVVYVGSGDGHLYAVDLATGTELWRYLTGGAVDSSPAVADGVVYVLSRDGYLHAVDAAAGTPRWSFQTEGEQVLDFWDFYLSDPLVYDGRVVFGSGDGSVYALDQHTGELQWRFRTEEIVHAAPIAAGGLVYVGGFDGVLYALRLETGEVVWQFATEGAPGFPRGDLQRAAALRDGVVYVGSRDYHIYAIDATDGSLLWRQKEGDGWIIATPLLTDDAVFFGASDGRRFYALDRATGDVRWSLPVYTRVFGSAVPVGDLIVFGGFNGRLLAVDPVSGLVQWRFQTAASRANFATVYNDDGTLNAEMLEMYRTPEGFRAAEERLLTLGSIPGTPAVRGTMVYFATTEGVLYALETATLARAGAAYMRQ